MSKLVMLEGTRPVFVSPPDEILPSQTSKWCSRVNKGEGRAETILPVF